MEIAVYKLGKLRSKYLIFEVLGFSDIIKTVGVIMWRSSKMIRLLLVRNRKVFKNLVPQTYHATLDFDNTASENFGLTLKVQKKIKEYLNLRYRRFKHLRREWLSTD